MYKAFSLLRSLHFFVVMNFFSGGVLLSLLLCNGVFLITLELSNGVLGAFIID